VLPNFFLAGVPKAGTTSLYHYLAQHPQIYMSPMKEPCYFASEFRAENCGDFLKPLIERDKRELKRYFAQPVLAPRFGGMIEEWGDYVRLFDAVRGETAIGEATPGYLWSETAAAHIHAKIPDAKILIMLRDPADRAFSQYLHVRAAGRLRRTFREHIEANRRNCSQKFSLDHPFLEFGFYYEGLLRFFRLFPRESISVQLYDDYCADPAGTFSAIFRFLGVDPAFVPDSSKRHLEGRLPRRPTLAHSLQRIGVWQAARKLTPRCLLPFARRMAYVPGAHVKMSAEDRQYLVDYYAADVCKTAQLIGRDLSAWMSPFPRGR
jgi:hypothetical protein